MSSSAKDTRGTERWFFEPGAIALDDFVARRMFDPDGGSSYWPHQSSWLAQRDNPDVMLLTFEGMKRDLPGAVRRIAGFLDLDLDAEQLDERISIATRHSSFDFMSTHAEPFSEPLLRRWVSENVGIPLGNAAKVRVGAVGAERKELSSATAAMAGLAGRAVHLALSAAGDDVALPASERPALHGPRSSPCVFRDPDPQVMRLSPGTLGCPRRAQ